MKCQIKLWKPNKTQATPINNTKEVALLFVLQQWHTGWESGDVGFMPLPLISQITLSKSCPLPLSFWKMGSSLGQTLSLRQIPHPVSRNPVLHGASRHYQNNSRAIWQLKCIWAELQRRCTGMDTSGWSRQSMPSNEHHSCQLLCGIEDRVQELWLWAQELFPLELKRPPCPGPASDSELPGFCASATECHHRLEKHFTNLLHSQGGLQMICPFLYTLGIMRGRKYSSHVSIL